MSLASKLRVLGFCVIFSAVGAGLGEAMRMTVRNDKIKEITRDYHPEIAKIELARVNEEYAFLSPKDISYLEWGAGAGLGFGLLCLALSRGGNYLNRYNSGDDNDRDESGPKMCERSYY